MDDMPLYITMLFICLFPPISIIIALIKIKLDYKRNPELARMREMEIEYRKAEKQKAVLEKLKEKHKKFDTAIKDVSDVMDVKATEFKEKNNDWLSKQKENESKADAFR